MLTGGPHLASSCHDRRLIRCSQSSQMTRCVSTRSAQPSPPPPPIPGPLSFYGMPPPHLQCLSKSGFSFEGIAQLCSQQCICFLLDVHVDAMDMQLVVIPKPAAAGNSKATSNLMQSDCTWHTAEASLPHGILVFMLLSLPDVAAAYFCPVTQMVAVIVDFIPAYLALLPHYNRFPVIILSVLRFQFSDFSKSSLASSSRSRFSSGSHSANPI